MTYFKVNFQILIRMSNIKDTYIWWFLVEFILFSVLGKLYMLICCFTTFCYYFVEYFCTFRLNNLIFIYFFIRIYSANKFIRESRDASHTNKNIRYVRYKFELVFNYKSGKHTMKIRASWFVLTHGGFDLSNRSCNVDHRWPEDENASPARFHDIGQCLVHI